MAVYFDMDGVLADFAAGVAAAGARYVPADTRDREADRRMWDAIKAVPHFYKGLPEIPAGMKLFRSMQSAGLDPEVLTAVPKPEHGITDAGPDKAAWNAERLGPEVRTHVVLREEKKDYVKGPGDVLIDDQERNIVEWEAAGGTGVLFKAGQPVKLPPMLRLKIEAGKDAPQPGTPVPEPSV